MLQSFISRGPWLEPTRDERTHFSNIFSDLKLEPQSDEINLIHFFMTSILVTFLVAVTKYQTRSNLRKKRFILTFRLRGSGTLWWGRCGSG